MNRSIGNIFVERMEVWRACLPYVLQAFFASRLISSVFFLGFFRKKIINKNILFLLFFCGLFIMYIITIEKVLFVPIRAGS